MSNAVSHYTVPSYEQLNAQYMTLGNDPISLSEKAKIALQMNKYLKTTKEDYGKTVNTSTD